MRFKFFLLLLLLSTGTARAQEPFYSGKTLRVIVGSSAGNTQDQMTRLVARYVPKYLPGHPNVIVENMSGASSVIAANYLFKVAKGDGLTIGTVSRALYFDQLVGRKEVQFDWAKFTWIGTPVEGHEVLFISGGAPYKSIRELATAGQSLKCGASGTTSTGYYIPKLVNEIFGTKFQIVTGYGGGAELDLAVQRGETQCRATSVSGFTGFGAFRDWRQSGSARVLVQTGRKRDAQADRRPHRVRTDGRVQNSRVGTAFGLGDALPRRVWLAHGCAAGNLSGKIKVAARGIQRRACRR